jgi:hypothetical protein
MRIAAKNSTLPRMWRACTPIATSASAGSTMKYSGKGLKCALPQKFYFAAHVVHLRADSDIGFSREYNEILR